MSSRFGFRGLGFLRGGGGGGEALRLREDALRAREEALLLREERVAQREASVQGREAKADVQRDFALSQCDRFEDQAQHNREANERLVIASLASQARSEAAEEAVAREDDFLVLLSDELRNPLAPIRQAVAILGSVAGAEPRLPGVHGVIERQAEQLTLLLDDLFDLARLRSGRLMLQRRPVAAHEFLDPAVESCMPLAQARSLRLSAKLPGQPVLVDGDPARLTHVFCNLLGNAIKCTPGGGTVTLSARPLGATLVVSVKDDGLGIPPEALPGIFDLFSPQAHTDQGLGGVGIGLAVVRRLVELHGGKVEAASAGAGSGSEFIVTLPRL